MFNNIMQFKWLIIAVVVVLLIVIFMPEFFAGCIAIGKNVIDAIKGVGEGLSA